MEHSLQKVTGEQMRIVANFDKLLATVEWYSEPTFESNFWVMTTVKMTIQSNIWELQRKRINDKLERTWTKNECHEVDDKNGSSGHPGRALKARI